MTDTPLWNRTALDLATSIAAGEVSSREVVESHLERIAEVNPRLNAITVEMADDARAAADGADRSDPVGPFHGVPFTIKENIDQVGQATTQGLAALAEARPPVDAVTVARMKAAGAIPIGRTNMPEMGLRVSTENAFRGLTRNPWSHDRTAGGSSGGEGSAIASGMSPMGLGNDIGGSIRNPALCCGVVGLKPGYGRIPRVAALPPQDPTISAQLMAVEGPLARSVADLRAMLGVLAGRSPRDPRVSDAPLVGPPASKRAGIVRSVPGTEIHPGAMAAIDDAADALAGEGWDVAEVDPPELELIKELWAHLLAFDFRTIIPVLKEVMGESEIQLLEALVEWSEEFDVAPQSIFVERIRIQRSWSELMADRPVLIGPGWTSPPFEHGDDVVPGHYTDALHHQLGFILPANLLGLPAVALTTGTHEGLPVGVQVYADHGREDVCLDAAETVEAVVGRAQAIDPTWR